MKSLNSEQSIIVTAEQLGLEWRDRPADRIIEYCVAKIKNWVDQSDIPKSIRDVERLACKKLGIVMAEIWTDEDLEIIINKYVSLGDVVFAHLKEDLSDGVYGVLMARRGVRRNAIDRYVAVIDCRGKKSFRRYFTRWHEIAHVLTDYDQMEFKRLFRAPPAHDPVERLVDKIAGVIGFFDPVFCPALEREIKLTGHLSLSGIERIRRDFGEDASFQATVHASISRLTYPIMYIEADLGFKKREIEMLQQVGLGIRMKSLPGAQLRVQVVYRNDAARDAGLITHKNMSIPHSSQIAKAYNKVAKTDICGVSCGDEDMSTWKHSDGSCPTDLHVKIETRMSGDRVISLVWIE